MRVQASPATTRNEIPAFFTAGDDGLLGVLTSPASNATETWVVLVPGGSGSLDSMNRNRLWVRLARLLGSIGCHAFRFDFHGAGESTGRAELQGLRRPFTKDLEGAVQWVQEQGAERLVVVGSCFGARTALAGAPEISGLRGLVLVAPYVQDRSHAERVATRMATDWSVGRYVARLLRLKTVKGMLNPRRRRVYRAVFMARLRALRAGERKTSRSSATNEASSLFLDPLDALVKRRIPILFIFGDRGDETTIEFDQAKNGRLGEILRRAGDLVDIRVLPGKVHGLKTIRAQEAVVEEVTHWLGRHGLAQTE
jgi:pimeloyl-ACP methyl ester carboxylesterase